MVLGEWSAGPNTKWMKKEKILYLNDVGIADKRLGEWSKQKDDYQIWSKLSDESKKERIEQLNCGRWRIIGFETKKRENDFFFFFRMTCCWTMVSSLIKQRMSGSKGKRRMMEEEGQKRSSWRNTLIKQRMSVWSKGEGPGITLGGRAPPQGTSPLAGNTCNISW